jgi:hypothetical protein
MRSTPRSLSAILLLLSLAACSRGGGEAEPVDVAGITAAHNAARAAVMPPADPAIPPLVWSGAVADVAQAWADHCTFMHSGGMYGENIYASTNAATAQAVVDAWVAEARGYDYATDTCSGTCGHYTQVVWRDSARLGCGVASCTQSSPFGGGSWQLWVCNYDPPGNFAGMKPY